MAAVFPTVNSSIIMGHCSFLIVARSRRSFATWDDNPIEALGVLGFGIVGIVGTTDAFEKTIFGFRDSDRKIFECPDIEITGMGGRFA